MTRDQNAAKASEIISDLQKLITEYGDLDCVTDDYGFYNCTNVVYVKSAQEANENPGPYRLKTSCFLIQ